MSRQTVYMRMSPDDAPIAGSQDAENRRRNREAELDEILSYRTDAQPVETAADPDAVKIRLAVPDDTVQGMRQYIHARGGRDLIDVTGLSDLPEKDDTRPVFIFATLDELADAGRELTSGRYIAPPGQTAAGDFVKAAGADGTLGAIVRVLSGFLGAEKYSKLIQGLRKSAIEMLADLSRQNTAAETIPTVQDFSCHDAAEMVKRREGYDI